MHRNRVPGGCRLALVAVTHAELFNRAGRALFGEQYVAPMAVLLGVDKNTVGDWRDGKSHVPAEVWATIYNLVAERYTALNSVRFKLSDAAEGRPIY